MARGANKAKRKSAVESSPPAEDCDGEEDAGVAEMAPSIQNEGRSVSTDGILEVALIDPEPSEESGDDEGPDDVLLVKGKDEALEQMRSEDAAVKRCCHAPSHSWGGRVLP